MDLTTSKVKAASDCYDAIVFRKQLADLVSKVNIIIATIDKASIDELILLKKIVPVINSKIETQLEAQFALRVEGEKTLYELITEFEKSLDDKQ